MITNSIIIEASGKNRIEFITIENIETGDWVTNAADALFIFIGARSVMD